MIAKDERTTAAMDDESPKRTTHHLSSARWLERGGAEASSEYEFNPGSGTREPDKCSDGIGTKKIALSFSVDRLLKCERKFESDKYEKSKGNCPELERQCCGSVYPYCGFSSCIVIGGQPDADQPSFCASSYPMSSSGLICPQYCKTTQDIRSILRPTPIRAVGNSSDAVSRCFPFTTLIPNFHTKKSSSPLQHQIGSQFQRHEQNVSLSSVSTLMTPLSGLMSLQINHQASEHLRQPCTNFQSKEHIPSTNSSSSSGVNTSQHNILQQQLQQHQPQQNQHQQQNLTSTGNLMVGVPGSSGKRKRSWSRAVFSNLQRKGLEIQFQQQKYITKPDRRKLAARLNLTDAQVKVWFQNRRMKWRHTRENLKTGQEKQIKTPESHWEKDGTNEVMAETETETTDKRELDYSTDASSSVEMSDKEDDDEIDVVE